MDPKRSIQVRVRCDHLDEIFLKRWDDCSLKTSQYILLSNIEVLLVVIQRKEPCTTFVFFLLWRLITYVHFLVVVNERSFCDLGAGVDLVGTRRLSLAGLRGVALDLLDEV